QPIQLFLDIRDDAEVLLLRQPNAPSTSSTLRSARLRHLRAPGNLRLAGSVVELCLRETGEVAARSVARATRSPRGSAAAPVRCRDARAESLEQIGRRRLLGFGGVMDLLAGAFVADDLAEGVAIGVRVLLRLEVTGEVVDQLLGHRELFLRNLRPLRLDLVERADLVGEVHLLEGEHPVPDP